MKTNTSKKSIWSTDDLHAYLDEAAHSFKVGQHWQQMLTILTSGDKNGDSEVSELTHLSTSLEVTRRIQIVRHYLMSIPRRRLSGGADGKTIIPAKTVLQQLSDVLSTPAIRAGAISPGEQRLRRLIQTSPQVTRRKKKRATQAVPPKATTQTRKQAQRPRHWQTRWRRRRTPKPKPTQQKKKH
jgi:hypothetical protein